MEDEPFTHISIFYQRALERRVPESCLYRDRHNEFACLYLEIITRGNLKRGLLLPTPICRKGTSPLALFDIAVIGTSSGCESVLRQHRYFHGIPLECI